MKEIDSDIENTVFSFIPNTAEVAYFGMVEGIQKEVDKINKKKLLELGTDATEEDIDRILSFKPRVEKLAVKDEKMRTFIADDASRDELVKHVYDVTYGIVKNNVDTLVLMDDSIVRGTTLRESIINILNTLKPKKIVIVSSAPHIRYPDCYGIDMSKMKNFVAFNALIELLKKDGKEDLLKKAYGDCKHQETLPPEEMQNAIQFLYARYTDEQISEKIAQLVTPAHVTVPVKVIYQTLPDLHKACPNNNGDWYFSGNYPTAGGVRVVNRAFINFFEGNNERAY